MDEIEQSGKTVEDALANALVALSATKDEVEYEVLDHGTKGFFGIGSKPCRILVKKKFNPVSLATKFLREVFTAMEIVVQIDTNLKEKQLFIDLSGKEMGMLIGKRGQTLNSLQYLLNLVVNKNKGESQFIGVVLDTENYRKRRRETLESLAHNLAKKAKQTRKKVVLEPMSASERRIIHYALQNDKFISTYSEGEEPFRYVVITHKGSL